MTIAWGQYVGVGLSDLAEGTLHATGAVGGGQSGGGTRIFQIVKFGPVFLYQGISGAGTQDHL